MTNPLDNSFNPAPGFSVQNVPPPGADPLNGNPPIPGAHHTPPGPVPDPNPNPNPNVPLSYTSFVASLERLMPKISDDDLEVLLAETEGKLKKTETGSDEDRINIDSAMKKAIMDQKKQQLDQAQQNIEDAAAKSQSTDLWDKIKLAFQALAAAVTLVVGLALIATGAGAALGVLLVAAAVVQIIGLVQSAMQETGGHGILGQIIKDCGGSDDAANKADMALSIYTAIVGIVIGIATCWAGGAGIVDIASAAAELATVITSLADATAAVATGIGDGIAAGITYQAANDTADAKDEQAAAKELDAFATQIDALITMIIQHLSGVGKAFGDVLDTIMDTLKDVNNTLMHVKLTA